MRKAKRKWKPKTATAVAIKFQEASDRAQCRYEQMTKDLFDSRQKIARLTEERDGLKRRIDSGYINDNLRFDSHSNSIVRHDGLKITSEFINCFDFRRMEDLASSASSWEATARSAQAELSASNGYIQQIGQAVGLMAGESNMHTVEAIKLVRGKIEALEAELAKYKPDRTICQMEVVKA